MSSILAWAFCNIYLSLKKLKSIYFKSNIHKIGKFLKRWKYFDFNVLFCTLIPTGLIPPKLIIIMSENRETYKVHVYQHSVCKDGKRSRVRQCVLVSESYPNDIDHWSLLMRYAFLKTIILLFLFFCGWNLRKNTCLYINVWLFTYGIMYKKTGYNIVQLTAKVLVLGVYVYIYIFSHVNKMFNRKH